MSEIKKSLLPYKGKKQTFLFTNAPFIFAEHYFFYSILYYYKFHNSITKRISESITKAESSRDKKITEILHRIQYKAPDIDNIIKDLGQHKFEEIIRCIQDINNSEGHNNIIHIYKAIYRLVHNKVQLKELNNEIENLKKAECDKTILDIFNAITIVTKTEIIIKTLRIVEDNFSKLKVQPIDDSIKQLKCIKEKLTNDNSEYDIDVIDDLIRDIEEIDPWKETKQKQIYTDNINSQVEKIINNSNNLHEILRNCVNNNSTDLSQTLNNITPQENQLVIDDSTEFISFTKDLNNLEGKDVHIIIDNCGFELISDIILGMNLFTNCKINKLYLHFNVIPIFVSDVIKSDIDDALNLIAETNEKGKEIRNKYLEFRDNEHKIIESPNVFWNMPIPFKNAPKNILDNVFNNHNTGLIIIKGDLNYRRLVEDRIYKPKRRWQFWKKSLDKKIEYIKKSVLILRSLKSNVILDVSHSDSKKYDNNSPRWKTAGEYGIIQFIKRK